MRQVNTFLRSKGINPNGIKRRSLIRLFAEKAGLQIEEGQDLRRWLLDLWASQENEHVAKTDRGFYLSNEWKALRKEVLFIYGKQCMRCGSLKSTSVDHIKPRSRHPELELDRSNLQVLCRSCNSKKNNRSTTDYRPMA